jgi:hypothetical protein
MLESAVNALAPVAEKLGNLIRLLSSDRDGEVGAALEAIKRTLKNANLSFHGLATEFVDDMVKRTAHGGELTEKQGQRLHDIWTGTRR